MTRASDLSGLSCRPFCSLSDVGGTRGKNRESCSCVVDTHGEVELRVIGVLVVVNTVVCDDVTHRAAVDGRQQRPAHITDVRNVYSDKECAVLYSKLINLQSNKLTIGE